jgi:hypothetical protein
MFCPKCATQNLEGASFCRTCGANISLIPQALTGEITKAPEQSVSGRRRRENREVTLEQAFKSFFMGVAFLLIAIALSRSPVGAMWWFWMLLPAFIFMGTGVGQYFRIQERQRLGPPPAANTFPEQARNPDQLRAPVASVTEGTTRHLGVEAPTRHFDPGDSK